MFNEPLVKALSHHKIDRWRAELAFARRVVAFEPQAAATEDNIALALNPARSFDIGDAARHPHSASVRTILIPALIDAPTLKARRQSDGGLLTTVASGLYQTEVMWRYSIENFEVSNLISVDGADRFPRSFGEPSAFAAVAKSRDRFQQETRFRETFGTRQLILGDIEMSADDEERARDCTVGAKHPPGATPLQARPIRKSEGQAEGQPQPEHQDQRRASQARHSHEGR